MRRESEFESMPYIVIPVDARPVMSIESEGAYAAFCRHHSALEAHLQLSTENVLNFVAERHTHLAIDGHEAR
jgi:hypothetical protein